MNAKPRREYYEWTAVWAVVALVTFLAIHRLRDFPAHLSFENALAGVREVFASTAWAAAKVWSFWALSAALIAGIALRIDPEIEQSDALLVGAGGVWVIAFLLGNLLGPIGLFNTATIWGLLALGAAWLWRNPPRIRIAAPSTGQKLAALAVALLAVSYLPLQLASPVVPFMDVLSYPSSVQRILTFRVYLPFDNDPYGCWGPYAQTPGLELFYAMLALGSRTHLAVLAESGAMLPMAALMIFGAYRLGKTLFNDTAGGIAGLFLFFTCLFRRGQGMRGTAVTFALVGLGLGLFMNRDGRRLLVAAGAMMLGTAVASHAIDGAFALIVAGAGALFCLAEGDWRRFVASAIALAGAVLIALPEFAVGTVHVVAYPGLPLCQIAGVALVLCGVRLMMPAKSGLDGGALRVLNTGLIGLFVFLVLYRHAYQEYSLFLQISGNLPLLFLFCFGGMVAAIGLIWSEEPLSMRYVALGAVALMFGIAGEYLDPILRAISHSPSAGMMASDIGIKLWDYWCPYFLTLPAGLLFALAYDRWSRPFTMLALLVILIYPWHQIKDPVDYDSVQHSITEQWAFNLSTAADGYWAGHADRRWTFADPEMALWKVLEDEIAAGRITAATHVLHLCENVSSWSLVQFSIFTGINDDPMEIQHDPNNLWEGGSRVRGMNELGVAMAARPPYVLSQISAPAGFGNPPPGYDLIMDQTWLRLYRRSDLARVNSPRSPARLRRWPLGVLLLALAIVIALRRPHRAADSAGSAESGSGVAP